MGGGGGVAAAGGGGAAAWSPAARAWAASRRAQSWKVGHTGKADERQYASWCARARGAAGDSAKHRWRWSGLVDRASRSSPNATNGHAGAPSMPGSPRSVIGRMIPAGHRQRHPRSGHSMVVIDRVEGYDRDDMQMPDVSDADEGYLCRVVEDCEELLGDGIELRHIEVNTNGEVVLRLSYRLGPADQTTEGRGESIIAAHAALRQQLVIDRIGLGVRALYRQ